MTAPGRVYYFHVVGVVESEISPIIKILLIYIV